MVTGNKAIASPERRRWGGTYNNLAHLLRTQQIQLEILLRERNLLERRINAQNKQWASVARNFEDQIFQMKRDKANEDNSRLLQTVKSHLIARIAQREASHLKLMLEYADGELAEDHQNLLDALKLKRSETTSHGEGYDLRTNKKKGLLSNDSRSEVLESEVIELRKEYDKLSLKKTAEVSALLLEKDFVWNQLKTFENDYSDKLRKKTEENETASLKIANLIATIEETQSSNSEKDNTIKALESKIAEMEADAACQRNEMSKVKYQLETLKKSTFAAASPSLRRCSMESKRLNLGSKSNELSRSRIQVKKEKLERKGSNISDHSGKGSTGLKRKKIEVITIPDTPKLFSSSFKAPKLKQSSPSINAS